MEKLPGMTKNRKRENYEVPPWTDSLRKHRETKACQIQTLPIECPCDFGQSVLFTILNRK